MGSSRPALRDGPRSGCADQTRLQAAIEGSAGGGGHFKDRVTAFLHLKVYKNKASGARLGTEESHTHFDLFFGLNPRVSDLLNF